MDTFADGAAGRARRPGHGPKRALPSLSGHDLLDDVSAAAIDALADGSGPDRTPPSRWCSSGTSAARSPGARQAPARGPRCRELSLFSLGVAPDAEAARAVGDTLSAIRGGGGALPRRRLPQLRRGPGRHEFVLRRPDLALPARGQGALRPERPLQGQPPDPPVSRAGLPPQENLPDAQDHRTHRCRRGLAVAAAPASASSVKYVGKSSSATGHLHAEERPIHDLTAASGRLPQHPGRRRPAGRAGDLRLHRLAAAQGAQPLHVRGKPAFHWREVTVNHDLWIKRRGNTISPCGHQSRSRSSQSGPLDLPAASARRSSRRRPGRNWRLLSGHYLTKVR